MIQNIIVLILLCAQAISCLTAVSLLIIVKSKCRPKFFTDDITIYNIALTASLITVLCGTVVQIIQILS